MSPSVQDSVQTVRSLGLANGKRAALLIIFRQPGANIITTVDCHQGGAAAAACEHRSHHRS